MTASTIVEAGDDVTALTQGIRIFMNLDIQLICNLSKVKLDVKPIKE